MYAEYIPDKVTEKVEIDPNFKCKKCGCGDFFICDNDCGTKICQECNSEYFPTKSFFSIKPLVMSGHNPRCGE